MSIIRRGRPIDRNFYILDKSISEDIRLTFEARGLLIYLLGKPDNWQTNLTHLATQSPAGRNKIARMLNELKEIGYITQHQERDARGKMLPSTYVVYEIPVPPRGAQEDQIETADEQPQDVQEEQAETADERESKLPLNIEEGTEEAPDFVNKSRDKEECKHSVNSAVSLASKEPEQIKSKNTKSVCSKKNDMGGDLLDLDEPIENKGIEPRSGFGYTVKDTNKFLSSPRSGLPRAGLPRAANQQLISTEYKQELIVTSESAALTTRTKKINFNEWFALGHIDPELLSEWVSERNKKRSSVSRSVIRQSAREFEKTIYECPFVTVSDCIEHWICTGWAIYKSDWAVRYFKKDEDGDYLSAEASLRRLSDTSWGG